MKHLFKVGGRYRNLRGEYEVISLQEPEMVIRFCSDNKIVKTSVELQMGILRHMQDAEVLVAPLDTSPRHQAQRRSGFEFQGLQEQDFQKGVASTSWRRRSSLGGLLAQRMSDIVGKNFESYAIYRRAEVHIVQLHRYNTDIRWREPKFVFDLDYERARYGFYIEKNEGPMDNSWKWLIFLDALERNTMLRQAIQAVMCQLNLHWEIHVSEKGIEEMAAQATATPQALTWKRETKDEPEIVTWHGFISRLGDIEPNKWCDLYLCAHLDKAACIAAGIGLAEPVVRVYHALLPLYQASTQ